MGAIVMGFSSDYLKIDSEELIFAGCNWVLATQALLEILLIEAFLHQSNPGITVMMVSQ